MPVPSSLRWLLQLTLSAALLCPVAFWWLDDLVAHWVAQYLSGWQVPAATITAKLDSVIQGPLFYLPGLLTLAGLFLGARLLSRRPFFTLLLITVFLRFISEGAANIVKMLIHRPRPGSNAEFSDSFPSGHTTIYFGTFLLFAACFPKHRGWILLVPTFIGAERVVGNLHYLSDVFAGIALAGLLTSVFLGLAYLLDRPLWRAVTPGRAAALNRGEPAV
jgi:membrane-associated phospholipid phosphatase